MLTRRELTTLLFAFTAFIVAYNLESISKRTKTFVPQSFDAVSLLGVVNLFRPDGRRVSQYVDDLERDIMGDMRQERPPEYDLEPYGNSPQKNWANGDVPVTSIVHHVPGYTILNNVFMVNGTLYVVSDYPSDFLKTESLAAVGSRSTIKDIRAIDRQQLINIVGFSAHRLTGMSWFCFDYPRAIDNHTYIALYRAHSALGLNKNSLPPPDRAIFANVRRPELQHTGYDLRLSRVAHPFSGILTSEDLDDLAATWRPVYFDQVLLADRAAALLGARTFDFSAADDHAKRGRRVSQIIPGASDKHLSFTPAFALPASNWWDSVRQRVLAMAGSSKDSKSCAVTYVSTQLMENGARLRSEDHASLVKQLQLLGSSIGCTIHIIDLGNGGSTWRQHVTAAVKSSVMLGVYGEALTYCTLLRPSSPTATVMEFFPENKFENDNEFLTRSLGIDYIAWRNTKKYPRGSLPPISQPDRESRQEISLDVTSVVKTVREKLGR